MSRTRIIILTAIVILGISIIVFGTDFWLLWLPIAHSSEYSSKVAALFMAVTAGATLVLAFATHKTIEQRALEEKRDRKDSILNEIRDWIFSIKDITLEPVTEENVAFRQRNIELKYGVPMNRVKLLETEIENILKDQDLKKKVSKVDKLLAAVMTLNIAKDKSGNVNENIIKALPGYVNTVKEILSEINEEANRTGKSRKDVADEIWRNYVKELNNAETEVLDKIVSFKSDLLKP